MTIDTWASSIAIRDYVFLQLFVLTVLGYSLWSRLPAGRWRSVVAAASMLVWFILVVVCVVNIFLWSM